MAIDRHILIVDSAGQMLEDMLPQIKEAGYSYTYLMSVKELTEDKPSFDAILTSSTIPGGAHGEDFSTIIEIAGERPVLTVAHIRSLSMAIDFFRQGVSDYLPAPVETGLLLESVERAINQKNHSAASAEEVLVEYVMPVENKMEPLSAATETTKNNGKLFPQELPCAIIVMESDGKVTAANSLSLSLFGADSEEELQKGLSDAIEYYEATDLAGNRLSPASWPVFKALKEKSCRSAIVSLKRKDGTRVWTSIEAMPTLSSGKIKRLCIVANNVTEICSELHRLKVDNQH